MPEIQWTKSSFSEEGGNNCVELAATADHIALRESEDPARELTVDRAALGAFVRHVKTGGLVREGG